MKKLIVISLLLLMVTSTAMGTVTSTATKRQYFPCNGSTKTFTFTMPVNSSDDIKVELVLISTGVPTTQIIDTDYTMAFTGSSYLEGGVVTMGTAPAATYQLVITRELVLTQETDSGAMSHIAAENAFDRITRIAQDNRNDIEQRVIRIPDSDPTTAWAELTDYVSRAGKYLTFDADGKPVTADGTTGVDVSAYAATYLDDTSEAAFKATTNLEAGADFHAYTANGNTILTDAGVLSIAGLTTLADRMIYTTSSDTYAVAALTASGRALIDDASTSVQRTTLGLAIGSDVHDYTANGNTILTDAGVLSIAGLTTAADKMIYTTASNTYATTDLTAFARTLNDDATAAEARTTLGVTTAGNAISEDGSTVYISTGAGFKDEDNMSSDSAVATASQQSVKKYVDDQILATALRLKGWICFEPNGTKLDGANATVSRTSSGRYTVTWGTDFADTNYAVTCSAGTDYIAGISSKATGAVEVWTQTHAGGVQDGT